MTTKIDDIYEAINTLIVTGLPTYARMPNAYSPDENSALILKRCYGIAIGSGVNTQRYVGCLTSWERSYTIVLITQVVNTENDSSGRATIEKSLIDAHRTLLLAFEADPSLGGLCIKAIVTGDTGIQYIDGQDSKFLAIEISLEVEYQESTT
jgi:hypothetical protein